MSTQNLSDTLCTIIVPTLASADRRSQLLHAVRSITDATSFKVCILVCVNGSRWDQDAIHSVEALPNVTVHLLTEPSLPKAIAFGRSRVTSPFFAFLDDDDHLLPNTLDTRINYLMQNEDVDLVVSNGVRKNNEHEQRALQKMGNVSANPLSALFAENWLPSCGGLFRSSSIGQKYFDNHHEYAEWTWLAFQLAMSGKRVEIIDEATFVINDTPGSLSKGESYQSAYLALYRRMLDLKPPTQIKKIIETRITAQMHDLSDAALKRGKIGESLKMHMKSLLHHGGLQYLPYTRHIAKEAIVRSLNG